MRLAVVTVNYCCASAILHSVEPTASQIADCGGAWWIVDNHSPDDSAAVLAAGVAALANVDLILASRNGGFGYGNNQVISKVLSNEIEADYLYFLNPDAVPEPGTISAMLSYLDAHPEVGVVGSGLVNEDGTHTDSMFRFPTFWSEIETALALGPVSRLLGKARQSLGQLAGPASVGWVAGTSFMVRSDVLRSVGRFDEDFFLYWEEVELCHRISKAGFAIHGLPDAKVRHVGGVSTGMHRSDERVPGYWHRSRNLYFRKTGAGNLLPFLNAATALCLTARRGFQFVRRAPRANPGFLRDHIKYALKSGRR